jgi:hypothetical protein
MGTLQAGTATVNITPDLGCHLVGYFSDRIADRIHDELLVKAIALTDGETTLGLITCDLIDLPVATIQGAKALIRERTGVAPEQILISATHTHTAPSAVGALGTPDMPEYAEWLIPRIADAFVMARQNLVPAEVAYASGDVHEEVHNRRWHMRDGSVRMNPGYQNPDAIRPAGPTDPQLGLLIVRDLARQPLAVYANLALHYVGNGQGTWVSADYFAEFGRALQRIAGDDFLVAMANGCQGNINNCDFANSPRKPAHPYHNQERVANVVAAEAWKQWSLLREEDFRSEVTLGAELAMVPFRARTPTAEELAAAQELYASADWSDEKEWIYARELVLLSEGPSEWQVPVHALRVGDVGLAGLHGEVFVEIGLDIKARSPFAKTMVVGLANGSAGYIATDQAMDEGSYETRLCRHVRAPKGTGKLWADTAVEALAGLQDQ